MSPSSARPFLCSLILVLAVVSGNAFAVGHTTRVSVATGGVQGSGNSSDVSLSADGRYMAFESTANNLVAGDTNNRSDIFIHDRLTKQTTRVSVATGGAQGNNHSHHPSLSADARYVAFNSAASNLVAGDTNGFYDVFIHDRLTGQTTRVSVATDGTQAFGSNDGSPALSADGRYVAFFVFDSNLVAGDTNFTEDIFVHDRLTKQTTRVSVATDGTQGNSYSFSPSLSADGRYVAFWSVASNLVAGDTNFTGDAFVHDRLTKQTTRVSVSAAGVQGNGESGHFAEPRPGLSADGRYVAFHSDASNLVVGDTNNASDAFVHDRVTGQTTRVNVTTGGAQGNDYTYDATLSADGRYVAFVSWASNLIAGDTNGTSDVFVHDRLTKQTTQVSVATNGTKGNSSSDFSSLSADGRCVAFVSWGNNLVAGDTNGSTDVFIRDRLFFSSNPTDLQITATTKPVSLVVNSVGSYTYTLTNSGTHYVYAKVTQLVSNGVVTAFTPSQGVCHRYATISLCELGQLLPGTSMTLTLTVKALRNTLHQQLTASSYGRDDPVKANNYLNLDTTVTP